MFKKAFFLIFLSLPLFIKTCHAQERILSFNAIMHIHEDASMTVQEEITVHAAGNKIKRGIFRDIPTIYQDTYGNRYTIGLTINSITLDGKEIAYHIKKMKNGSRIYIGSKVNRVRPGQRTFTINYTTNRHLGFFEKHDELYWNITGNGWLFVIEQAQATIHLPKVIAQEKIGIEGYTGFQGAKGQAYQTRMNKDGSVTITTTKELFQKSGLTVVMTWPKGIVQEPTWLMKKWYFFNDNKEIIISYYMLLILLLCYLILLIRTRRQRKSYTVVPLFHPPLDLLPSQIHYIINRGYQSAALTAEVVNMACNGFLTIEYNKGGTFSSNTYTLINKNGNPVSRVHQALLKYFFSYREELHLTKNNSYMMSANKYLASAYSSLGSKYFDTKENVTIFGGLVSTLLGCWLLYQNEAHLVLFCIATFLVHAFFYYFLRQYTDAGNKLLADINGFKLFLTTTELERMKIIGTPPTRTPELYEKYLPYAMAFGVEKEWTQQFGPMFAEMKSHGTPYVPIWYIGAMSGGFRADTFSRDLSSSLSSVIAASATPPGSSSGSGGSGSSGGGSGGGGGGGW